MTLQPVSSQNVAAVGFEAGRLVVKYRDGATYECGASVAEHEALMQAPSKGNHLRLHFGGRLKRSQLNAGETLSYEGAAETIRFTGVDQTLNRTLNTHDPDECCSKPLGKALFGGKLEGLTGWSCPKCGTAWQATMVDQVKHWAPAAMFQVFPTPRR